MRPNWVFFFFSCLQPLLNPAHWLAYPKVVFFRARRDARFGGKDRRVCCKVAQQKRYVLHMPLQLHTPSLSLGPFFPSSPTYVIQASCESRSAHDSHPQLQLSACLVEFGHACVCVRSAFVVTKSHLTPSCIRACIGQHGLCTPPLVPVRPSFTMQLSDDALSMFDSTPHRSSKKHLP